jgi:hypothetical protein
MSEQNENEYTVGYGKPPKSTQFKSGHSGNPKGRPRKSSTFADEIRAEMNSKIVATENGKSQKITKQRAIIKRHVINAINGNLGSAKLLIEGMQQDLSNGQDSLGAILDAFQERNRQLAPRPAESGASTDLTEGLTATTPGGSPDA